MPYEARIENDKLVMTDAFFFDPTTFNDSSAFKGPGSVEIPVSSLDRIVGAVEEETLGDGRAVSHLDVYFKDEGREVLLGLTLADLKTNAPALVEIEAMTCTVP
jgi:hypothetical protein